MAVIATTQEMAWSRWERGEARLEGIVADEDGKSRAGARVSALPGVKGVANHLRTMAGGLYRFPSQRTQ